MGIIVLSKPNKQTMSRMILKVPAMLHDADIRDSLCLFLEEKYGKVRFFDELRIGNSRADMVMVTEHDLIGIEIKSDADSYARLPTQIQDYREAMKDVYTTSVNPDTLDEAPMAYKSLEDIIDVIRESVDVIEIIKPIYNFKASE